MLNEEGSQKERVQKDIEKLTNEYEEIIKQIKKETEEEIKTLEERN